MSEQKNDCIVNRDFKFYVQKLVVFGKKERSLQDLLLIYTFFSIIVLIPLSSIVNWVLELTVEILYFDIVVFIFFVVAYYLSNRLNSLKVIRIIFIIASVSFISRLWLLTEGSSGPSILLFAALFTLTVFISVGKEFVLSVLLTSVGILILYFIEYNYPEMILQYASKQDKIIDTLSMVVLLFGFEIPILIYARNILYKQRDQAIETAENKSHLLANMSHEIRTPMNAILGFTELLSDPQIEKEEQKKYLEIVNQNSKTLMNLLNNVINVSKLNSDKIKVFYSKGNVNKILKYTYETLNSLTVNKKVELKYEPIEEEKANFDIDDNLLFQILLNLGYNALKFTNEGRVVLSAFRRGKYITFVVKDTGVGIPTKQQPCIFKRFQQSENIAHIEPSNNGAGLGLSICKRITGLLNGEIWFNSKEKVGSQFFVKLPVTAPKEK